MFLIYTIVYQPIMNNNAVIFQMKKRKVSFLNTILVIYFLMIVNVMIILMKNRDVKEELDDLPPLEGDEEKYYRIPSMPFSKVVKEGKGLKILAPNKLLTRLPLLLAQIKAGNNLHKLKNKIRQIMYPLYHHNKITMGVSIYDNKLVIITEIKTIRFNLTKTTDNSLKHETEFIIKSNEFLAEQRTKKETDQLLFKYNHGNDIHEHGKQQNQ